MPSIHIFGGGMSGLTAAFLLEQQQQDYQLFECGLHWGGKLQTTHCDGFAFDHGFQAVSLGKSRLRTETAGLAAVQMLQVLNR